MRCVEGMPYNVHTSVPWAPLPTLACVCIFVPWAPLPLDRKTRLKHTTQNKCGQVCDAYAGANVASGRRCAPTHSAAFYPSLLMTARP